MIQAKQQNPFNSEGLIRESAGSPPLSMRHVGFARPLAFAAEKGEPIVVEAGLYRVEASDDGRIVLVSDTGEATPVPTVRDWHDQAFDAPVALDVEREDEHALVLLLPGGLALHSSGSYGQIRSGHTAGAVHDLRTTWPAIFQKRLYSPSGRGVPTVFELRVDGVTLAKQTFFYFASYSGGPSPEIRP